MKSASPPAKMAHPGTGSTGHLATFLLAQALGVKVDHIPYRGAAPMLQDMLGGHIDLFFATPQQVVGAFAGGEIKVFGITSKEPSPQFPGVPSFVAAYGPKLEISFWHIMLAPAATPEPVDRRAERRVAERARRPGHPQGLGWQRHGALPAEQRMPAGAAAYLQARRSRTGARWCATTRSSRRPTSKLP